MGFRWPWVGRARFDAMGTVATEALRMRDAAATALKVERDKVDTLEQALVRCVSELQQAAKIVGIIVRRNGRLRVTLEDLQMKAPRITMKADEDARKPGFQIIARFDDFERGVEEATIVNGRNPAPELQAPK